MARPRSTVCLTGTALCDAVASTKQAERIKVYLNGHTINRLSPSEILVRLKSGRYEGVVKPGGRVYSVREVDDRTPLPFEFCWRTTAAASIQPYAPYESRISKF